MKIQCYKCYNGMIDGSIVFPSLRFGDNGDIPLKEVCPSTLKPSHGSANL